MHKGLCGDSYLQNTDMLGDPATIIPQIIFFQLGIFSYMVESKDSWHYLKGDSGI